MSTLMRCRQLHADTGFVFGNNGIEEANHVDAFFEEVLVMVDNQSLRENRIALLNELGSLFLRVADFSRLQ